MYACLCQIKLVSSRIQLNQMCININNTNTTQHQIGAKQNKKRRRQQQIKQIEQNKTRKITKTKRVPALCHSVLCILCICVKSSRNIESDYILHWSERHLTLYLTDERVFIFSFICEFVCVCCSQCDERALVKIDEKSSTFGAKIKDIVFPIRIFWFNSF